VGLVSHSVSISTSWVDEDEDLRSKEPPGNEIKVRYLLAGFEVEPEEITKVLDLSPSTVWRGGDAIAGTARKYKENGWLLQAPATRGEGIASQLSALLDLLESRGDKLKGIVSHCYSEFSCVIYANEYVPEIHLEAEIVQRIGRLGAAIDIDLYYMVDQESEL